MLDKELLISRLFLFETNQGQGELRWIRKKFTRN